MSALSDEIGAVMAVLKGAGVMQASVKAQSLGLELAVVFAPEPMVEMQGEVPTPGGWKSPPRLDNSELMYPESFPQEVK